MVITCENDLIWDRTGFFFLFAALTSHLVSFGDQSSPGGAGGGALGNHKTPEDSPYLVMSPVDPEAKDFSLSRRSTPPVKQRTASIDSTSGSGSGKCKVHFF